MRLSIDHHTRYRFSVPQARVVQLLRVTPSDYAAQTVIDWRIDVDRDARLRTGFDGYGNPTTMLYIDGPLDSLELTVRGEVLTEDLAGVVNGAHEPLPPLYFTRPTPSTDLCDATRDLARSVRGSDWLERIHGLNHLVGGTIRIEAGRGPVGRTPGEILDSGHGTTRDAAHLLVAVARASGCPSRIVSGHSLHGPNRGLRRSAHYWAEIHIDRLGWVGLDPSSGTSPDESYVRVAVGLDAYDCTPVSGTRVGGGVEELDVDVRVETAGGQQQ
jgi:transglutaminase-like putative cysteine protease